MKHEPPEASAKKCGHDPCGCEARVDDDFCSDACRQAVAQQESDAPIPNCPCGHASCSAEAIGLAEAKALQLSSEMIAAV